MLRRLPYGANFLNWDDMAELKEAIDHKILFRYQTTIESKASRFEQTACELFGVPHALAVHNCTEALRLSLLATRPRVGDLVYIPAMTFVAVAGAALSCGLIPVLVDVDENFALYPTKLPGNAERVIVAHMEGVVGPVPKSVPFVIEDAAQAFGAKHPDGRYTGTVGYTGVFSFHHNKMLTSGEGGLIITHDVERWELMRKYHDHGSNRIQGEYPTWERNAIYGENCVSSEPIAAIQLQQLRHLETIKCGLERGYRILREVVPANLPFQVLERQQGDVKLSLRLLLDSPGLRLRLEGLLKSQGLAFWTLDRYFLPEHPVLRDRQSIYADGFPWNLAPELPTQDFSKTKERLARLICLSISPEISEEEQWREAQAYVRVLRAL